MFTNRPILALILLLFPLLACSLTGDSSNEAASSQISVGGEPEAADTVPPAKPPATVDVQDVERSIEITATPAASKAAPFEGSLGLNRLESFQATIEMEFAGATGISTGNETTTQRQTYFLEVTQNPRARHQLTNINSVGWLETDATLEMYLVDDVTYTRGAQTWIAQSGLIGLSQFANPETLIPLPATAVCEAEPETVNSVSARHCRFSEADQVSDGLEVASLSGDVWLTEDGNYVVRYQMEAQKVELKGEFSDVFARIERYRINYDLTEINSNFTIELPPEAQEAEVIDFGQTFGGSSGIATPDGVEIFVDSPNAVNYFSPAKIASLIDFHRQSLSAEGWTEIADEGYIEEASALLVFENEAESENGLLRVFIFKELDGGYFVSMTLPFETPIQGGDSSVTSAEFPVLDNAEELLSVAGITTYYTQAQMQTVVDFYRQELPALGWLESESEAASTDDVSLLMFEKDGARLMLTISAGSNGRLNVGLLPQ